jgi:hypothetical protein
MWAPQLAIYNNHNIICIKGSITLHIMAAYMEIKDKRHNLQWQVTQIMGKGTHLLPRDEEAPMRCQVIGETGRWKFKKLRCLEIS